MTHMTDEQKNALQRVVMYLWRDEERDFVNDFENDMSERHVFECLVQLREFLEQEDVEVFPEPDWHKNFEKQSSFNFVICHSINF